MTDSSYAGQKGAVDGASELNAIDLHIRKMIGRVATVKLVRIKKIKGGAGALAEGGTVAVEHLVNLMDGEGKPTSTGTTFSLPYIRSQGGGNGVIIDPEEGDIGLALICDRDISKVKSTKDVASPGSNRRHDVADGVYIGGILNGTPKQYIRFTSDGIEIGDKNGNKMTFGSKGVAFTTVGDGLTNNLDIVAGKGGSDQVSVQNHLHQNAGGSGNSGKPVEGT